MASLESHGPDPSLVHISALLPRIIRLHSSQSLHKNKTLASISTSCDQNFRGESADEDSRKQSSPPAQIPERVDHELIVIAIA